MKLDKICALVVCYKDYDAANTCIDSILSQSVTVEKIYVVDNTDDPDTTNKLYKMKGVEVLETSGNLGISGAYHLAFNHALSEKMQWCWTFDQDSVAHPNALAELIDKAKFVKTDKVGILASTGISTKNGALYKGNNASWLTLKSPNLRQSIYKCDLVISAGSLTNLNFFEQHGYSFKDMFIDWVDFEICIDMNRHGYSVYSCQTSFFDHYIGGNEEAEYANSQKDADSISDLRLKYLISNSIKVIKESRGLLKYPYLIFHLYKLYIHAAGKQKKLWWETTKASLLA